MKDVHAEDCQETTTSSPTTPDTRTRPTSHTSNTPSLLTNSNANANALMLQQQQQHFQYNQNQSSKIDDTIKWLTPESLNVSGKFFKNFF